MKHEPDGQATGSSAVDGAELDRKIASRVMGWGESEIDVYGALFQPSTDIAAAMRVIAHLEREGYRFDLRYATGDRRWQCTVDEITESSENAALCICRATLRLKACSGTERTILEPVGR